MKMQQPRHIEVTEIKQTTKQVPQQVMYSTYTPNITRSAYQYTTPVANASTSQYYATYENP